MWILRLFWTCLPPAGTVHLNGLVQKSQSTIAVVGIRTDFRNAGDTDLSQVNAMNEGSCVGIARNFAGVLKLLKEIEL